MNATTKRSIEITLTEAEAAILLAILPPGGNGEPQDAREFRLSLFIALRKFVSPEQPQ